MAQLSKRLQLSYPWPLAHPAGRLAQRPAPPRPGHLAFPCRLARWPPGTAQTVAQPHVEAGGVQAQGVPASQRAGTSLALAPASPRRVLRCAGLCPVACRAPAAQLWEAREAQRPAEQQGALLWGMRACICTPASACRCQVDSAGAHEVCHCLNLVGRTSTLCPSRSAAEGVRGVAAAGRARLRLVCG